MSYTIEEPTSSMVSETGEALPDFAELSAATRFTTDQINAIVDHPTNNDFFTLELLSYADANGDSCEQGIYRISRSSLI